MEGSLLQPWQWEGEELLEAALLLELSHPAIVQVGAEDITPFHLLIPSCAIAIKGEES